MASQSKEDVSAAVINLCTRRGLIASSSEIYGGYAGFFDFIGYGAQLKRNLEIAWWKHFVEQRGDMVGLDGAIITHPLVWRASGHLESFNDPLVDCTKCKRRFRADQLIEEELKISVDGVSSENLGQLMHKHAIRCPNCKGELSFLSKFNLMFKTQVGAGDGEDATAYLRGETAQSIFVDFRLAATAGRKSLPFGIAQVGKAFRNEIAPRNFLFRCREFSQMEIEYFIHPKKIDECPLLSIEHAREEIAFLTESMQQEKKEANVMTIAQALEKKVIGSAWHAYWLAECHRFLCGLGLRPDKLRAREHIKPELSHYSKETWDIEYEYQWGWKELLGIANRGDFDLTQHAKLSGKDLSLFDEESKQKVVPHVLEPSFGVERLLFTLLIDAYESKRPADSKDANAEGSTIVLKLSPTLAPVQLAILPLMKKDGLAEKARELWGGLRGVLRTEYDESGSIGKRYARMDEVGTAYCATIDYQTLEDGTVTLRDRDTTAQVRLPTSGLERTVRELIAGRIEFPAAGLPVKVGG